MKSTFTKLYKYDFHMAAHHPDPAAFIPPEFEIFIADPQDDTPESREASKQHFYCKYGTFYTEWHIFYDFLIAHIANFPQSDLARLPPDFVFDAQSCYMTDYMVDNRMETPPEELTEKMEKGLRDVADALRDHMVSVKVRPHRDAIVAAPEVCVTAPARFVMPNTKLMNELTRDFINAGTQKIETGTNGRSAVIVASLTCNDNSIHLPASFTPYDRAVLNAVCSEVEQGNSFIWPVRLYRTMTGKTGSEYVDPATAQKVVDSLDKMMYSKVCIDYTEQARLHGSNFQDAKVEGNLLYAEKISATVHGALIAGYRIIRKPLLLDYSKRLKQIVSIPIKLLDTGKTVRNSPENIAIKQYLIQRIETAKSPKNHMGNRILYSTIFKECQLVINTRQQRSRYKSTVIKLLEHWRSVNYISGYTSNNGGIELAPDTPKNG